ncbi:twin-arginine translocase TatA/TatE family subunit [Trichlorobacter lovleyi]|uniref:Sec-independent protein translocase protein TatA n=1 Tax=Trichlorobacter lovleyi (strain ATCC BAA-1151 / DSM 17278 / SZ) TaxID=398767 RepID=B3E7M4_TRIL1|nr:twin-arginine translocase TatA/TatE family subunit [Trichlorobacter lovleyi]ACD95006.1 twin-arginine translocation protein, TatA/E family subunit [Trichlorobacter lovleyi SZ]QOX80959.1 twin-arginine translocase TatA/TatE family subunit [Trichlorobacter lovleyi]
MFGIGMPELVIIMVLALIVIGPQKLPELAKSLGKGLGEFKKATDDFQRSVQVETKGEEQKEQQPTVTSSVPEHATTIGPVEYDTVDKQEAVNKPPTIPDMIKINAV